MKISKSWSLIGSFTIALNAGLFQFTNSPTGRLMAYGPCSPVLAVIDTKSIATIDHLNVQTPKLGRNSFRLKIFRTIDAMKMFIASTQNQAS